MPMTYGRWCSLPGLHKAILSHFLKKKYPFEDHGVKGCKQRFNAKQSSSNCSQEPVQHHLHWSNARRKARYNLHHAVLVPQDVCLLLLSNLKYNRRPLDSCMPNPHACYKYECWHLLSTAFCLSQYQSAFASVCQNACQYVISPGVAIVQGPVVNHMKVGSKLGNQHMCPCEFREWTLHFKAMATQSRLAKCQLQKIGSWDREIMSLNK